MRDQIRDMIDRARTPLPRGSRLGDGAADNVSQRLAAEAIRLARLAAAMHMTRAATLMSSRPTSPPKAAPPVTQASARLETMP